MRYREVFLFHGISLFQFKTKKREVKIRFVGAIECSTSFLLLRAIKEMDP